MHSWTVEHNLVIIRFKFKPSMVVLSCHMNVRSVWEECDMGVFRSREHVPSCALQANGWLSVEGKSSDSSLVSSVIDEIKAFLTKDSWGFLTSKHNRCFWTFSNIACREKSWLSIVETDRGTTLRRLARTSLKFFSARKNHSQHNYLSVSNMRCNYASQFLSHFVLATDMCHSWYGIV